VARLVLSPDAFIRFRNGEILIHNAHSGLPALATRNAALTGFVARFAMPLETDQLRTTLRADEWAVAAELIGRLRAMNVLVDAGHPAQRAVENDESEVALAMRHLGLLANSTHKLAGDLQSLGPQAARAASETGVPLESRLTSLLSAVDSMRSSLAAIKAETIAAQVARLGAPESLRGLKLHIGAGSGRLAGWVNIDVHPADLALNVTDGLSLPEASAHFVFASHILEHLYYPTDALPFLRECLRVLAPGGVLRIIVPDVEQCIRAYAEGNRAFFESRIATWKRWPQGRTPLEDFLAYSGAGPDPASFLESHKYGYDFETLRRALEQTGFKRVVRSNYMESAHAELRVDDVSEVAGARYGERYYSLLVEAEKQSR